MFVYLIKATLGERSTELGVRMTKKEAQEDAIKFAKVSNYQVVVIEVPFKTPDIWSILRTDPGFPRGNPEILESHIYKEEAERRLNTLIQDYAWSDSEIFLERHTLVDYNP